MRNAAAPPLSLSVIVPAHNGLPQLRACLQRIREFEPPPDECILVDDGSEDDLAGLARELGFHLLATGARRGPAFARNLGARHARGDLLLFLDADVLAPHDLIARLREVFRHRPAPDAVIGSYDDNPAEPDFFSQYRNLLHCYVHQTGREAASTFWSGCGAIRREVFLRHNGFQERYQRPSIEDIELGLRLRRAGCRIALRKDLQVKHLKRWSFWQILRTDVFDRAIPWTSLILGRRSMPADLNLRWRDRASVVLWFGALIGAGLAPLRPWAGWLGLGSAAAALSLNREFYRFLAARRGWWFALRAAPMHTLYFLYSGASFLTGIMLYAARRKP